MTADGTDALQFGQVRYAPDDSRALDRAADSSCCCSAGLAA